MAKRLASLFERRIIRLQEGNNRRKFTPHNSGIRRPRIIKECIEHHTKINRRREVF